MQDLSKSLVVVKRSGQRVSFNELKIAIAIKYAFDAFPNKYDKQKLIEGTSPTIDNYKNFALTNKGLNIYFEYYQIAPYYYGYSEVTIPYNEINLML